MIQQSLKPGSTTQQKPPVSTSLFGRMAMVYMPLLVYDNEVLFQN